jgi:hypothetical protein
VSLLYLYQRTVNEPFPKPTLVLAVCVCVCVCVLLLVGVASEIGHTLVRSVITFNRSHFFSSQHLPGFGPVLLADAFGVAMGKRAASDAAREPTAAKKARTWTSEQMAAKKVLDNFPHFSNTEIDVTEAPGPSGHGTMTLRKRVVYDCENYKLKKVDVFKPSYYAELRNAYRCKASLHQLLSPVDKTKVCSPRLFKALVSASKAQPDRSIVESWFLNPTDLQEHEASALMRLFIRLRTGCKEQLRVALNALRYFARSGFATKFSEKFKLIFHVVDEVLCATLRRSRAQKVPDDKFLAIHKDIIGLIWNPQQFHRVAACAGDFESVRQDLTALACTSALALDIYEVPLAKIMASIVMNVVKEAVHDTFAKVCEITTESLQAAISKTLRVVEATPGIDLLPRKRTISVQYCNLTPQIEIGGILDEVMQRFFAAAKMIGLRTILLSPLWFDDAAIDVNAGQAFAATLSADVLECQQASRAACRLAFADASVSTGDVAEKNMKSMAADMVLVDETFKLEMALSTLVSSNGADGGLKAAVLSVLPTATRHEDLAVAVQKLNLMIAGSLYKFSSFASQGKVTDISKILSHLLDDNLPPVKPDMWKCPFMKPCLETMPLFFAHEVPGAASAAAKILRGVPALTALYEALMAADATPTLSSVTPLELYSVFMPVENIPKIAAIVENARKAGGVAAASALTKKKSKKAAVAIAAKPGKKVQVVDNATAASQALFD